MIKPCKRCQKDYAAKLAISLYCKECKKAMSKERIKKYLKETYAERKKSSSSFKKHRNLRILIGRKIKNGLITAPDKCEVCGGKKNISFIIEYDEGDTDIVFVCEKCRDNWARDRIDNNKSYLKDK